MILDVDNSTILLSFFGRILKLIHIGVPIALIVFVSFDLIKAVVSQDNEMVSKAVHSIKNRVIASILVFLAPTIVEVMFSRVFVSLNMDIEEYNKILSSYRSVINSKEINTVDESKNNFISASLNYSMNNITSNDEIVKNEINFYEHSKNLTSYIFNEDSFKSIVKAVSTNDFEINYENKKYTLNDKFYIKYSDINTNDISDNGEYIICNIALLDAIVLGNDKYDKLTLSYNYKKQINSYLLYKIDVTGSKKVDNYLDNTSKNEKGRILSTSKYVSNNKDYDYSKLNKLSDDVVKNIFNQNKNNIVTFKTISNASTVNVATGFFINNGIVATSWSYLKSAFLLGQTIVVFDYNRNTYKCNGIISIDTSRDIVVVKLDKEVKRSVSFDLSNINKNDPVVSVTSKTGIGYTSVSGIVYSSESNLLNVLPISKNDWGSPIFNEKGKVIGITTSKLINSEISNASKIDELYNLQKSLSKLKFKDIKSTNINDIKKKYYYKDTNKEKIHNGISEKVWKKYKDIGDIENSIVLDLVKASYYDGVVSLRYSNITSNYLDNKSYASNFISNLEKDGYKKISDSYEKIMYKKGNKKVIIMSEFNYLIVVLVKGGIKF